MTVRELSLLTRGLSATAVHQPGGLAPDGMPDLMLTGFRPVRFSFHTCPWSGGVCPPDLRPGRGAASSFAVVPALFPLHAVLSGR